MNKIIWIFTAILLLIGGVFAYNQYFNSSENSIDTVEEISREVSESTELMNVPDGAYSYKISDGSTVSYVALKEVFGKPSEYITGTTDKVNGSGWFNPVDGIAQVQATLNVTTIKTEDATRDSHVQDLFTDKNIKFVANISSSEVKVGEPFEVIVLGEVTINGITKPAEFKVLGTITEPELQASGSTTVKMSDFGINPPSIANVSTVNDNLELKFDIKASQ